MHDLMTKVKGMLQNIKTYWSKPKKGDYVSYKEFSCFCLGASANNAYASLIGYITFASSCLLVGAIYNIAFKDIYVIGLLGMPFSFIFNPINMIVQDNLGILEGKTKRTVHSVCLLLLVVGIACYCIPQKAIPGLEKIIASCPQILGTIICTSVFNVYYKILTYKFLSPRFGKFICWIVSGCIPSVVMFILIVFLPFKEMPYYTRLWILHLCFSMFGIFNVFSGQLANIQNVISPNTDERARIMSIGSVVFSAVPSLVGILLPVVVVLTGGFSELKTYKIIFPVLVIAFALCTLILAFTVKEKVVIERDHKPKVGFVKGFKAVIKNKYYWITNLSGLPGFLGAGGIALVNIVFIYITRQDWLMGVYFAITGFANVPGMLLAPWLIKKIGKRNIVLITRIASFIGGFAIGFATVIGSIPLFILFNFLVILIGGPMVVVGGAITADIWDYQQYKTGERLDGCAGIFGLILTPISTVGGFVVPLVYGMLNFSTDWEIMYVKELRDPIIWASVFLGAAATFLGTIPYFFYDLTEKKHRELMMELKKRAGLSDEDGEIIAGEGGILVLAGGEHNNDAGNDDIQGNMMSDADNVTLDNDAMLDVENTIDNASEGIDSGSNGSDDESKE